MNAYTLSIKKSPDNIRANLVYRDPVRLVTVFLAGGLGGDTFCGGPGGVTVNRLSLEKLFFKP